MDTRLLRSFLAVARSGSFTSAAGELGYTQSTVTSHVQKLEQQLRSRLLDRLPGGVVTTEAGARLVVPAEEVLDAEDRLRAAVSAGDERPSGTVRVMAPETLCTYWLPRVIRTVIDEEPDVRIWLAPGSFVDAVDAVRRGAIDVAVVMEPRTPQTDMTLTPIGRQALVFLDRADPTAGSGPEATWAELAQRDVLLIEEGCGFSDHVTEQLDLTGCSRGRRSRFGSVEAVKRCVGAGLGWTVLPTIAVGSEIEAGTLTVLDGPALVDCAVQAVTHPRRYRSPATRVVLDELRRSWSATAG
ncbi:LysR family transcriptional regulator [Pseudonocardia sichuanensis]